MDAVQVRIRPEQPADFGAINRIVTAAFESRTEATLVELIRASEHYIPEMALVAERADGAVGHVMISGAIIATEHGNRRIAILAPLAVDPEVQRGGVGSALVTRACAVADQRGEPMVVLEGNPAYYGKFGFEPAYEYGIELPLPGWAPRDAGQVLRLSGFEPDLQGRVIYPAAFNSVADEK